MAGWAQGAALCMGSPADNMPADVSVHVHVLTLITEVAKVVCVTLADFCPSGRVGSSFERSA